MVIRNNARAGLGIIAGEGSGVSSNVVFGSTSDINGANLSYTYNTKTMALKTQHASGILKLGSGNGTTAVTIDASQNATFAGSQVIYADGNVALAATKGLFFDGGTHTSIAESAGDNLRFTVGGSNILDITTTSISGSATSTGSFGALRAGVANELELGDTTFANYVGMKTEFMDGGNDYMLISGNADGNTYMSAKDTKSVEIRGGGNRDSNKIVVPDNTFIRLGGSSTTLIRPSADNQTTLGAADLRFSDVFAIQTTTGGIFETGLRTKKIGDNPTGTIVSWDEDGLVPCDKNEDELVMGVIKNGKDEPIVLGAEPVLVTGKVNVGDYIVTSDKIGHGKSVKRGYLLKKNLFGKVIAQALEPSDDSDSCLIKCMIRKM